MADQDALLLLLRGQGFTWPQVAAEGGGSLGGAEGRTEAACSSRFNLLLAKQVPPKGRKREAAPAAADEERPPRKRTAPQILDL